MTDSNGITLSSVTVSASNVTVGENLTVGLTLKNESGVKIPSLQVRINFMVQDFTGGAGQTMSQLTYMNETESGMVMLIELPNGDSVSLLKTFVIPDSVTQRFELYPNIRAVPVYVSYYAETAKGYLKGNFTIDGLSLLNRRYNPAISTFSLERATDGTPNDEGENVLTDLKLSLADTTDYTKFLTAKLYYAQNDSATTDDAAIDLTGNISTLLTGVTNSATLITQTFSRSSDWDFMLVFGDAYESAIVHYSLGRAFANVHLSGASTGGVCFGGFSGSTEGDPRFESHYPAYLYGGIAQIGDAGQDVLKVLGIQAGSVSGSSTTSGKTADYTVTFDEPYATPPVVVIGMMLEGNLVDSYYAGRLSCALVSVSETGFTVRSYNYTASSTAVNIGFTWSAFGKLAAADA